jgi:hypothetical protein
MENMQNSLMFRKTGKEKHASAGGADHRGEGMGERDAHA